MGTTFSSSSQNSKNSKNSKNGKNDISESVDTLRKEVSFLSNPVTEEWSQSPRNSDEFYKFTKADVNRDEKRTSTRKEINKKKNERRRSITRYYEIKRQTDLIDHFKPERKRKLGLDDDDDEHAQIGGYKRSKKRKNTRKKSSASSSKRRNNKTTRRNSK